MDKLCSEVNSLTKASKYLIITDENIKELYAQSLLEKLKKNKIEASLIAIPAGEKSKSRYYKALIEDQMIEQGFGRDSAIIALGGGMISDLAGFVAGTFCRGIPFIIYATSLLAAADASIGGKVAINTLEVTNIIGLFYQPKKVFIDLETWKTLPIKELQSGLAETIKHACLADKSFFFYLENNLDKIINDNKKILNKEVCEFIAIKNCQIKHEIVCKDEKEENLRQVLNLGHTAGRALEALLDYRFLHGECISMGLVIQLYLGQELGFIFKSEANRIISLLKRASLPTSIPKNIEIKHLVQKMKTDKKTRNNKIHFVFQDRIGKIKTFKNNSYSLPLEESFIINCLKKYTQSPPLPHDILH